jgi:hypothetical protein
MTMAQAAEVLDRDRAGPLSRFPQKTTRSISCNRASSAFKALPWPHVVPSTGASLTTAFACNQARFRRPCGDVVPVVPGTTWKPLVGDRQAKR